MVRKRELTVGIIVLLIATLAYLFGWTNIFTVKKLEIIGAPNPAITNTVIRFSDVRVGQKLARVEPRNIEGKLISSGIDWLESVDISRNWISGKVVIDLKPREAVATTGDRFVDPSGFLFLSPVEIKEKLPELVGKSMQERADGIKLYQRLPDSFQSQVIKIVASSQDNFQFYVEISGLKKSGAKDSSNSSNLSNSSKLRVIKINWGSPRDSDVKLKIYKALLELPENNQIKSMDLSDPTKPSVR